MGRTEATDPVSTAASEGKKFGEQWKGDNHELKDHQAMLKFHQELNNATDPKVRWAELRAASEALQANKVLPDLEIGTDRKHHDLNCRIVGTTADTNKTGLVVAIGHDSSDSSKAKFAVILGEDGHYYRARQTKDGLVQGEAIAKDATELTKLYQTNDARLKPEPMQASTVNENRRQNYEHGGVMIQTPTSIDIQHGPHTAHSHFEKCDGKWVQTDDQGQLIKSKLGDIQDITVGQDGSVTVKFATGKRTYLTSDREVETSDLDRTETVTGPNGNYVKLQRDASGAVTSYEVSDRSGRHSFYAIAGKPGWFSANGQDSERYQTNWPVVDQNTGEVTIHDTTGNTYIYI
jgi:hypothetical protein